LVAYILRAITFAALRRTGLGQRASHAFGAHDAAGSERAERMIAKGVFYTTLAFVFVAFFSQLRIDAVTDPIVNALSGITGAIPNLLKAGLIGFVGYLFATLARRAVSALVDRTHLSERLSRIAGENIEDVSSVVSSAEGTTYRDAGRVSKAQDLNWAGHTKLAHTSGEVAFWVVLAITAVPVLESLRIGALATPLSHALEAVTTYAPRIIAAALLLAVGYVLSRFLQKIITNLAHRAGVDRLVERFGGDRVLRGQSLSSILGSIVMAFVLLHFAISAVGRLQIPEISAPLGNFLTSIYAFLPRLLVGGLVLIVGIVVARLLGNLSARLLAAMGFNTLMAQLGIYRGEALTALEQEQHAKAMVQERRDGARAVGDTFGTTPRINGRGAEELLSGGATLASARTPADVGGLVVTAAVAIIFLRQALDVMHLHGFAGMLDAFLGYLPHLFVACVLLAASVAAANWARRRVAEMTAGSDDRLMRSLDRVVYVAIITVGVMMAAQQLGVGAQLIGMAFSLILGAVCLALALAFGLGGREVAGDFLKREVARRQRDGRPLASPGE
jgi:hypothetical protein